MNRSDWQPIKTAPKDGTIVDVWLGGDVEESDLMFYCTPGTRRSSGWSWQDGKWRPVTGLKMPVFVVPTHWMHLPNPPKQMSE